MDSPSSILCFGNIASKFFHFGIHWYVFLKPLGEVKFRAYVCVPCKLCFDEVSVVENREKYIVVWGLKKFSLNVSSFVKPI